LHACRSTLEDPHTIGNVGIIIPVPKSIEELSGIAKGLYDKDYIETLRDEWG
jgi:hypothetical protein